MANLTKYSLLFLAGCLAAASCSKEQAEPNREPQSSYVGNILVSRAPLAIAGDDETEPGTELGTDPEPAPDSDPNLDEDGMYNILGPEADAVIDTPFEDNKSILYISQRTRLSPPFQQQADGDNNNNTATPTYKYIYFRSSANWEEGYNFGPANPDDDDFNPNTDENPNNLKWEDVGSNGPVGNGFALYALYFPENANGYGRREVEIDQSAVEKLQYSDVQGAYHSTAALYSRVRFKLFHMMTYIKVNLYVPKFQTTWKNKKEEDPSGFLPQQLINAWVKNVCPTFSIDWTYGIGSDESPRVTLDPADPTQADDQGEYPYLKDIVMYSHAHSKADMIYDIEVDADETEGETGDETGGEEKSRSGETDGDGTGSPASPTAIYPRRLTRIDVAKWKFLPKEMLDVQPLDLTKDENGQQHMIDTVYLYSFSAIIPPQYSSFTDQTPGWLKFQFEKSGGIIKDYYFQSGFSDPSIGNENAMAITQGTEQILNLYLPRKGDEVLLVGANVIPWTDIESDMNLSRPDSGSGSGSGGGSASGAARSNSGTRSR